MICSFFKLSFIERVGAFIFELDGGKIYNIVKFEFKSMSCKIERAFEKRTKIWAKKAVNQANKKDQKSIPNS